MKQYLELLNDVLDTGVIKGNRTGVETIGVFGRQLRFDLSQGFPMLSTKRLWLRGIAEELFWFLRGETDVNKLPEQVQKWWWPWADEWGNLGPLYGKQYRRQEEFCLVEPRIFEPYLPTTMLEYGKDDHDDPYRAMLVTIWRDMMKRCYISTNKAYQAYGAKGVHVSPDWCVFANFQRDAKQLIGWLEKLTFPSQYSLDKDVLFASNRYSKETCKWANHWEQSFNTSTGRPFTATSPKGIPMTFASVGQMARDWNMSQGAIHNCLNDSKKVHTHHGWSNFHYVETGNGRLRVRVHDQLATTVARIKHTPDSRRLVMSLFFPRDMETVGLPCCHGTMMQFNVTNGVLNCMTVQRSADTFIGLPVNIASYALLMHIVAQLTNLVPGELVYQIGDCHVYQDHIQQVRTQLERTPTGLPSLTVTKDPRTLDTWEFNDLFLCGYNPQPGIKAPIAV